MKKTVIYVTFDSEFVDYIIERWMKKNIRGLFGNNKKQDIVQVYFDKCKCKGVYTRSKRKLLNSELEEYLIKAGKSSDACRLIAVSKTKPVEDLREAYDHGMRDFGENKVQEMCDKMEVLPDDIRWHMIGHLQTNKVKYLIGKVFLIHSVDSIKLAKEISRLSVLKQVNTDILIEINVAGEESKFGTSDMAANLEMIKEISTLEGINIRGLMTVAPFTDTPEDNRIYFKTLHDFAYGDAREFIKGEPVLSMGMSGDYMIAASEGASYIRVGSKIFGERNYNIN